MVETGQPIDYGIDLSRYPEKKVRVTYRRVRLW